MYGTQVYFTTIAYYQIHVFNPKNNCKYQTIIEENILFFLLKIISRFLELICSYIYYLGLIKWSFQCNVHLLCCTSSVKLTGKYAYNRNDILKKTNTVVKINIFAFFFSIFAPIVNQIKCFTKSISAKNKLKSNININLIFVCYNLWVVTWLN